MRYYHASHTAGIARSTQTFQQIDVVLFRASWNGRNLSIQLNGNDKDKYLGPFGGPVHAPHRSKSHNINTPV